MGSKLGGTNQDRVKRETAVRDRMVKREKDVLDKSRDVSLRAMDREYAELLKKQTELVTVKSGINYFKDTDDAQRRSMRGTSSRSNLAAASNRQLQKLYVDQPVAQQATSGHSLLRHKHSKSKLSSHNLQPNSLAPANGVKTDRATPGISKKGTERTSTPKQVHMESNKPGTSGVAKVKQETKQTVNPATPDSAKKGGKGKGKAIVHKDGADKSTDTHKPIRERGSHDSMHPGQPTHKHPTHGQKTRRQSITGQSFNQNEMEEQQKILDLFIHLVEKVDDNVYDPADHTMKKKDGSRASMHEKTGSSGSHHQTQAARRGSVLHDDPNLMKDLQGILEHRRKSTDAHGTPPEIPEGLESASQTPYNRGGKRRMSGMEMITDIIGAYKTQYVKEVTFDPLAMLNCGYLRLSDSNVTELERLCREQGIDPGIHAHSNVDDFVLFPERNK